MSRTYRQYPIGDRGVERARFTLDAFGARRLTMSATRDRWSLQDGLRNLRFARRSTRQIQTAAHLARVTLVTSFDVTIRESRSTSTDRPST